jgi:uncharacterized membrane protein YdfJ with MMPL/SSD domain
VQAGDLALSHERAAQAAAQDAAAQQQLAAATAAQALLQQQLQQREHQAEHRLAAAADALTAATAEIEQLSAELLEARQQVRAGDATSALVCATHACRPAHTHTSALLCVRRVLPCAGATSHCRRGSSRSS